MASLRLLIVFLLYLQIFQIPAKSFNYENSQKVEYARKVERTLEGMNPTLVIVKRPGHKLSTWLSSFLASIERLTTNNLRRNFYPESLRISIVEVDKLGEKEDYGCTPKHYKR